MNEKYPFENNSLDYNPEIKTNQNIEAINSLLSEWDDDKSETQAFSLDDQANFTSSLDFTDSNSSDLNDGALENISKNVQSIDDPLEKTMEIKSVDIEEVKNLLNELHELYDEPNEEISENTAQGQNKGKALVKATKQGIAFSNGSMTRTFLDCTILCFVTASMGFGMLMYIFSHI